MNLFSCSSSFQLGGVYSDDIILTFHFASLLMLISYLNNEYLWRQTGSCRESLVLAGWTIDLVKQTLFFYVKIGL